MDQEVLDTLLWSDMPALMKIYEESEISYYAQYVILRLYHAWHFSFPEKQIFVLTPGGKVDRYGTFIVLFREDHTMIIFDSMNQNIGEMKCCLKACIEKYISLTSGAVIGPVKKRFWPIIDEIAKEFQFDQVLVCKAMGYYMDKNCARDLPLVCPEDAYIGPLTIENADTVNSVWPHRFEGSINLVKFIISSNGGVGIFLKESGVLVSWALQGHLNGPQFLQTADSHKRKGYGYLSAIAISKYVAEKDIHPVLYITEFNTPSRTLFNKLGYQKLEEVSWTSLKKS